MEDHHESKTRVEAADALGAIKDVRAIEPLIKLLGDSDPYLPNHAARALGEIGDVRAVKPLIASLEDEEKGVLSGLREDAARVLGKIGDSSAVEALIRTLENPYKWLRRRCKLE